MSCLQCGVDLSGKKKRFCSTSCRQRFWTDARQVGARRIQAILVEAVSSKTTPVSILEQENKRHGMAAAANSNAEILNVFRIYARYVSKDKGVITIDDVRQHVDRVGISYTPGNWLGSVFTGKEWVCVGFKPATHAGSRGRIVREWKLK